MKIVLIGAGNLATNLGKALLKRGHEVMQVWSRTKSSASMLANKLHCSYTTNMEEVVREADLFIIAVKDDVLSKVADVLSDGRENQFFVHTAGSMPMDVLPTERRGVLYPMQTFSKQKEVDFSVIPCFIEANHEEDFLLLRAIALTICLDVFALNSENRKYLHLAAVFCCNFANHCYTLGEQLLKEHGNIPFGVMLPLIEETAAKLHTLSPSESQTGPAVRWDENVMNKHVQLLADKPNVQEIYELMSKSIHSTLSHD